MTATQYRAALARLGLTQVEAARLLGVTARTSRNWAEKGVKGPGALLLGLLDYDYVTKGMLTSIGWENLKPIKPAPSAKSARSARPRRR